MSRLISISVQLNTMVPILMYIYHKMASLDFYVNTKILVAPNLFESMSKAKIGGEKYPCKMLKSEIICRKYSPQKRNKIFN